MASYSHVKAVLEEKYGTLDASTLTRLTEAIKKDTPSKHSNNTDYRLRRIEECIESLSTTLRAKHQERPHGPNSFSIRYSLAEQPDVNLLRGLKNSGIVEKFRLAGPPFDDIRACNVKDKTLFLCVHTPTAEAEILKKPAEIGEILGLSDMSRIIHEKYLVQAMDFSWQGSGEFADPDLFISDWSEKNGVTIRKAFWTYRKLILQLDQLSDAVKLCKQRIYLSGYQGWGKPFDKRSTPKFCYNCAGPGHLQNGCNKPRRCLRCGQIAQGSHDARNCGNLPCCANCGGDHEAYNPQCQNEAVCKMNKEATRYRNQGPRWAQELRNHPVEPVISSKTPAFESAATTVRSTKKPTKKSTKKITGKNRIHQRLPSTSSTMATQEASTQAGEVQPHNSGSPSTSERMNDPELLRESGAHVPTESAYSRSLISNDPKMSVPKAPEFRYWVPLENDGPKPTRVRGPGKVGRKNIDRLQPPISRAGLARKTQGSMPGSSDESASESGAERVECGTKEQPIDIEMEDVMG